MLGYVLEGLGKKEEAITAYEQALTLNPTDVPTRVNLANVLAALERYPEAFDVFGQAIAVDENYALAHFNRAVALESFGWLEEAMASFRRAEELFSEDQAEYAKRARTSIQALARRIAGLPGQVLSGRRSPLTEREWQEAVRLGYDTNRYAEVVALAERILRETPELVGESSDSWGLYNSACSAALLASSSSVDLSPTECARLRGLAYAWLRREVDRWGSQRAAGGPEAVEAARRLAHALEDPDLASLRGDAIAELPSEEQGRWQILWGECSQPSGPGPR